MGGALLLIGEPTKGLRWPGRAIGLGALLSLIWFVGWVLARATADMLGAGVAVGACLVILAACTALELTSD